MSSSYDSVLIHTSLECVVLAFCTHWQFEDGKGSAPSYKNLEQPSTVDSALMAAWGAPAEHP